MDEWLGSPELVLLYSWANRDLRGREPCPGALSQWTLVWRWGMEWEGILGGGEDKDFPVPGMLSLRWLLDTQVAMSDWQLEMEVDSWI